MRRRPAQRGEVLSLIAATLAVLATAAAVTTAAKHISAASDFYNARQSVQTAATALEQAAADLDQRAQSLDSSDPVGAAQVRQRASSARETASTLRTEVLAEIDEAEQEYKKDATSDLWKTALGIAGGKLTHLMHVEALTLTVESLVLERDTAGLLGLPPGPDGDPKALADALLTKLGTPSDVLTPAMKSSLAMEIFRRRVEAQCIQSGAVDYACLNRVKQELTTQLLNGGISSDRVDVLRRALDLIGKAQGVTPSAEAGQYFIFVLQNVESPGSIYVGTLAQVQGKRTCDFTDGGLCSSQGGSDVPLQYAPKDGPFPTSEAAVAAYCGKVTNVHPAFGGTKGTIYDTNYWLDNAPSCPQR